MKRGSTATCIVEVSLGVAGLDDDGAVPEDAGSVEGVPISVIGVSIR